MWCHHGQWPLSIAYRNIGIVSRSLLLAVLGSGLRLGFRLSLGLVEVSLGLIRVTVTLWLA